MSWPNFRQVLKRVYDVKNNVINTYIQDQKTSIIDAFLHSDLSSGNLLLNPVSIDDYVVTLTPGHGATIGNYICFGESDRFYQAGISNVVGDVITLDTPLDYAFTGGVNTFVCIGSTNMNIDGSVATQIFKIAPPAGVKWDITRLIGYIQSSTVMDDRKFGGIVALTNGVVVRKKDTIYKNIFNVKTNGDLALRMYDVEYTDKAPAGFYGMRFRRSFAGPDKNGVVIHLDGALNDELRILIRDDLTNLSKFNVIIQGHVS